MAIHSMQVMEDSRETSSVTVRLAHRDALLNLLQSQTKELLDQHSLALSEVRQEGIILLLLLLLFVCVFTHTAVLYQ